MANLGRRSLLVGSAAAAAAVASGVRPAAASPGALANALLVLPPELDGRIFPQGTADLSLSPPPTTYSTGTVDGGVLRSVTSLHVPWNYTQSVAPTDPAIGTAVFVDWNATLNDLPDIFGPRAQTGWFGPRGVFHLGGEVRYQRHIGPFNITPIGFAHQLAVSNTDDADRVISPGWAFMNNQWFISRGNRKLTLRYNDTARGMAGFVDNQLFTVAEGTTGTIDGTTHQYEALSFLSRTFLTPGVHLSGVVGFDMADVNDPSPAIAAPPVAVGQVDYTIGLRVGHLQRGGSFGIGVQNGSRTVRPPQTATIDSASSSVRTDATYVVVENDTTGPLTLTSVPTLPDGREGQIVTLINGGTQPVTLQGESTLTGSNLASPQTLLPGDVVDLVFDGDVWRHRSETVSWQRTRSLPGVSSWIVPPPETGVTTYQTTHPTGGVTGIDLRSPAGETAPSTNIRMFFAGDTVARTLLAAGTLGFSDGANALTGSYLTRTAAGVVRLSDFLGSLHTLRADLNGGLRRDVLPVTTTTYAVVADDRRRTVTRNNSTASTMTWPTDSGAPELVVGTEIPVCNLGTGAITHQAASGATVVTTGTQVRGARWVGVKVAANTWCVG